MQLSLRNIADHIGGTVIGDQNILVTGLASLDDAREGQITFLANPKYAAKVGTTNATAVIVPPGTNPYGKAVIETKNPYLAFAKVLTLFCVTRPEPKGVMDGAFVSADASLGNDITVYPGAYIAAGVTIGDRAVIYPGVVIYEKVTIGDDVTLHANVCIREGCRLGSRIIVHNGAVIGSDGFGYAPDGKTFFKIPQIGIVVIGDDVEIGANTAIDRAALHVTRIGRGVKIDNLVQIAHNCIIGEDTAIAGQTGIAGSCTVGSNVSIGGQVAITDHVSVGDNIMLGARTGVMTNVYTPGVYSGTPAMPHKDWLRVLLLASRLPEMNRTISVLEKRIAELESRLGPAV